jgi:hypothetical protein
MAAILRVGAALPLGALLGARCHFATRPNLPLAALSATTIDKPLFLFDGPRLIEHLRQRETVALIVS